MPDRLANHPYVFQILALLVSCASCVIAIKGRRRWLAAYLACVALVVGAWLLSPSRVFGEMAMLLLGVGIGMLLMQCWAPTSGPIVVFDKRPTQPLIEEMADSKEIWAAWHTGHISTLQEVIKARKIIRLLLMNPGSEARVQLEKVSRELNFESKQSVEELTTSAKEHGAMVKWFNGSIQDSVVIADADLGIGWARLEFLIPFSPASLRPSIKVFKQRTPELFNRLVRSYEDLWDSPHSVRK